MLELIQCDVVDSRLRTHLVQPPFDLGQDLSRHAVFELRVNGTTKLQQIGLTQPLDLFQKYRVNHAAMVRGPSDSDQSPPLGDTLAAHPAPRRLREPR